MFCLPTVSGVQLWMIGGEVSLCFFFSPSVIDSKPEIVACLRELKLFLNLDIFSY